MTSLPTGLAAMTIATTTMMMAGIAAARDAAHHGQHVRGQLTRRGGTGQRIRRS